MVILFAKNEISKHKVNNKLFSPHFSADHGKIKENLEVPEESLFVKCVPLGVRQRLPWITFIVAGLWGLTSDTILSFYDVVSDYLLAT